VLTGDGAESVMLLLDGVGAKSVMLLVNVVGDNVGDAVPSLSSSFGPNLRAHAL